MKQFFTLLLSLCLLQAPTLAQAEGPSLLDIQRWMQALPQLLEERSETSAIYIKNYLQCMDDEQALAAEEQMSVQQIIEIALDSSNECAPLLREMLDALTDDSGTTNSDSPNTRSL
jgi:hypothetical protein